MRRSVGVVVPAYRPDVAVLADYVTALEDALSPVDFRIELDDPREETVDALADLPATVNSVPERRGKGAAITAGFEALDAEVFAFADADASTPAASVAEVVERLDGDGADLAVGSRRHPQADVRSHQTFARRRLGDGFAWIARLMLEADLYDYQCGAKAVTAECWTSVREHLYEPGFAWDVELVAMAAALDHEVVEVPVTWEDTPGSTVAVHRAVAELLWALVAARHRAKRIEGDGLHAALAATGGEERALVDRLAATSGDD